MNCSTLPHPIHVSSQSPRPRVSVSPRLLTITLGLILLTTPPAAAQQQKIQLTAEVDTPAIFARSCAAVPVTWTIHSEQTNLVECRLQYELVVGGKVRGRFETHDLAIGFGDTKFSALLPSITTDQRTNYVDVKMRVVTGGKVVPLSDKVLRVQPPRQRIFVTAVCDPWASRIADETSDLVNHLRIEQFHPGDIERAIDTTPAYLAPDRLPAESAGYCGFDLLVLLDEGFSTLRERQLVAIRDWVDAGGSVLVRPRGTLQPHHVTFLNDAIAQTELPPFTLDGKSRLVDDSDPTTARFLLTKRGLGRVALVRHVERPIEFDSAEWRRTAAWLWKLRADQIEIVSQQGKWSTKELDRELAGNQFQYGRNAGTGRSTGPIASAGVGEVLRNDQPQTSYPVVPTSAGTLLRLNEDYEQTSAISPRAVKSGDWLLERLMPPTARVISLPMVGVILGLYLVAVGPLDYLLLGAIRRHKFTFLLFPAVTIGVTYWTVRLSDANLRTNRSLRALRVLDVGPRGKIVRENRFELLFANVERETVTEVKHEVFTQLDPKLYRSQLQQETPRRPSQYNVRYPGADTDNLIAAAGVEQPATHEGQLPSSYRVRQRLKQFTPQINHRLAIAPELPLVGFDWDAPRPTDFETPATREQLAARLRSSFGDSVIAYLMHSNGVFPLTGETTWMLPRGGAWPDWNTAAGPMEVPSFLQDISARPATGLFTFVSQISPTGGDNLEDLTVLDPSDRAAWLLLVVVEQGDDVLVYRKLYD